MDRFTWGVVAAVLLLATVAFAMVGINRAAREPADLSTPAGTVQAFIAAVHDRRADEAWRLLEGPDAIGPNVSADRRTTEVDFKRQVESLNNPSNRRIRILEPHETGAGRFVVDVEVISGSDGPFLIGGGSSTRRVAFTVRQVDGQWRITAAPSLWDIR